MKIFFAVYNYKQNPKGNIVANKHLFYKTIIEGLRDAGHTVICADCQWGAKKTIPNSIITLLKKYQPDLCMIGNFGFWDIFDFVECPICYIDIDSYNSLSMATVYKIRNHLSRCFFVSTCDTDTEAIIDKFNASMDKIIPINLFYREISPKIETIGNIVCFDDNYMKRGFDISQQLGALATEKETKEAEKVLECFKNNPFLSTQELYNMNNFFSYHRLDFSNREDSVNEIWGKEKLNKLSYISDLGLGIIGAGWALPIIESSYPKVFECAKNSTNYDITQYSQIVSKYKIVLIFDNGPFVKGSYLRVLDAVASDACVVIQQCDRYTAIIDNLKLISFKTDEELRLICEKLLSNATLRRNTIKKNQELLNKEYCVKNAIEKIENRLLSAKGKDGTLKILSENDIATQYATIEKNPIITIPSVSANNQAKNIVVPKKITKKSFSQRIKTFMIHFGYDYFNKYSKKSFKFFGFIVFEKLFIDKKTTYVFLLSFPLLDIKNDNGITVGLLFIEKLFRLIKKCLRFAIRAIKGVWRRIKRICAKKNISKSPINKAQQKHYVELRKKIAQREKITVCLFVSRISCWTFANLYSILQKSDIFNPIVVVKPFMFNGYEAMVEYMNTTYEALKSQGYNVIKTYDEESDTFLDLRKEINPDIVFYTKYWLPQFQENFYINKFEDKLTFYTSYCFDIAYHPACMNFELNNKVNRYFMPSEIHKHMAEQVMNNGAKNVHVVGAPKLDVFFDKSYVPKDVWKPQEKKKKRIIWAPHHSDNFPGNLYQFNAFYELTEFMFEMAEKYKDEIQIAFKPHPMLKPYLVNKKWGKESAKAYYQRWAELENGQLETGEFIDLFLTSDAMILDSISFIAEYTATNKPALFTIGSTSRVQLNEFGGVNFKVLYHTDNDLKSDIEKFIVDVVINGNDVKADQRTEFIEKFLLPPNGKTAAQNIYDNILDEIQNGDKK